MTQRRGRDRSPSGLVKCRWHVVAVAALIAVSASAELPCRARAADGALGLLGEQVMQTVAGDGAASQPAATPAAGDGASLQATLDRSVRGMEIKGRRVRGTGRARAWWNNTSNFLHYALPGQPFSERLTCYQQADVVYARFLAEQESGSWAGWQFEKFDDTAPWRKGEGIDHMYVKATSPDGTAYRVDPWLGQVRPFVRPTYEPGVWDWASRGIGWFLNVRDYWTERLGR